MSGFTHYKVDNDIQRPIMKTQDMEIDNTGQFLEKIKKDLKINITKLNSDDIEFDLIGVDAAIANALRRILLSEVPTIAVETVWISVNTSIIQDEVLAHRIGLIPIKADPRKLEFPSKDEELSETDCIVFHFDVSCPPPAANLTPEQRQAYKFNALSGEMKWNAVGNQDEVFAGKLIKFIYFIIYYIHGGGGGGF
jgi:DNA-directed RNA polymerase I and III subunit RPAC1